MDIRDRQRNGVIEGVGSCGSDLASLVVLQVRLAACDLKDSAKAATPVLAGLTVFSMMAAASVVIGLAGVALWLASRLDVPVGIVMMAVAMVGLIVSGIGATLLAWSLSRCFTYLRRSQEELERNFAWVKTTLMHSGR